MKETVKLFNRLLDKIDEQEKQIDRMEQRRHLDQEQIRDLTVEINKERSLAGSYRKEAEKLKDEAKRLNKEAIELLDETIKLKKENEND